MELLTAAVVFLIVQNCYSIPADNKDSAKGAKKHSWGYENGDPDNWHKYNPTCGGVRQSPIDIMRGNAKYNSTLKPLDVSYMNMVDGNSSFKLRNNGHGLYMDLNNPGKYFIMWNGVKYVMHALHFHWGSRDERGSEHKLDGKQFPLEMHMVHHNSEYADIQDTLVKSDGLVVLGTIFQIQDDDNMGLSKILSGIGNVEFNTDSHMLEPFDLMSIMAEGATKEYFTYPGSLTTPGCGEAVTWLVSNKLAGVSMNQMDLFRMLHSNDDNNPADKHAMLEDNFRPVQPLNGRVVESSFMYSASASKVTATALFACVATALLSLVLYN